MEYFITNKRPDTTVNYSLSTTVTNSTLNNTTVQVSCDCKSMCKTKLCPCKNKGETCNEQCHQTTRRLNKCQNVESEDEVEDED